MCRGWMCNTGVRWRRLVRHIQPSHFLVQRMFRGYICGRWREPRSLWKRALWRGARGGHLIHALVHGWRTMWSASRLLCRCPWPSRRLLLGRHRRDNPRTGLLVCVYLVSLSSCGILDALRLQICQCRSSRNTGGGEARFDATTRRGDNGRLWRWGRASLCSDGRCGSCGAQAIHTTRIGYLEYSFVVLGRVWRREVLLVVLGEWIVGGPVRAAFSLGSLLEQTLLIWSIWAR